MANIDSTRDTEATGAPTTNNEARTYLSWSARHGTRKEGERSKLKGEREDGR